MIEGDFATITTPIRIDFLEISQMYVGSHNGVNRLSFLDVFRHEKPIEE